LKHPGEEIHSLDLVVGQGATSEDPAASARLGDSSELTRGRPSDLGPIFDPRAKQEIKFRIAELTEEFEELQLRGAYEQAEKVADEITAINRTLLSSLGLGGRDRKVGSASEKARVNVFRNVRAAIERITEQHQTLGKLLDKSIQTGTFCCYLPKTEIDWQFEANETSSYATEAPQPRLAGGVASASVTGPEASQAQPEQAGFIGRTAEREVIGAWLRRVINGENAIVTISGAPGIGKTRLARAIGADARRLGFVTLSGNCYDREDSVPYIPMVEILEAALAQARSRTAFRTFLGAEAAEVSRLMPQMRRDFPDIPAPFQGTPEQARRTLFNALVEIITRQSRIAPLLLLVEDIHWADEGTLAMINHFVRAMNNLPVMLMLTYRDDAIEPSGELSKTLDELLRLKVEHVRLQGLSQLEVTAMAAALGGQMSRYLLDAIYSYTEGNPLFVQELVRHLVNNQPLGVSLALAERGEIDLPHSLRLVIGRRLALISEEAQKMLGTAAVIGRSFSFALLEAATQIGTDELVDLVEEAEEAGLLTSRLRRPDTEFNFSHELIRQAVLNGLSGARRQRLHLSVAKALEAVYANALEDRAEDLAHQLWSAGSVADPGKTIHYLEIAGTKAVQTASNTEAIKHFTDALTLLSNVKDTPERLQQELRIHTALGAQLVATKGFSSLEVKSLYAKARELSQRAGQSPEFFRIVWGQWVNYASRCEYEIARQLGQQCLELAQAADDPSLLIEAHHALGVSSTTEGKFTEGVEHFEQVFSLYDPARHSEHIYQYGQDPAAICHIHAAQCLWFLGYPEQAQKHVVEGLELGRTLAHPGNLATVAAFATWVYQYCRDARKVRELAETTVKLSTEHGLLFSLGMGTILGGWALTQLGHREEGITQMEQGLGGFRAADAVMLAPCFSSLLAEAYADAGRLQDGWELLASLAPRQEPYWEAELCRLKGELFLRQSDVQSPLAEGLGLAEDSFREALSVASRQAAKSLELRAVMGLAHVWLRQGKREAAANIVSEKYTRFSEGFNLPDLRQAREFLEKARSN
jgi:tetratricopeptide (TPR) repeat protein